VGLFALEDGAKLSREGGTRFSSDGDLVPADDASVAQGFLEASNVNPLSEIARLIEVQRAYEAGQSFLENEDKRVRSILTLIQR